MQPFVPDSLKPTDFRMVCLECGIRVDGTDSRRWNEPETHEACEMAQEWGGIPTQEIPAVTMEQLIFGGAQ